jgi:hypothetical protein
MSESFRAVRQQSRDVDTTPPGRALCPTAGVFCFCHQETPTQPTRATRRNS